MRTQRYALPVFVLGLAVFSAQVSASPVFTEWTANTNGVTNGTASGTLGSINVTFSGDVRARLDNNTAIFNDASYTSLNDTSVFTPSLSTSDAIKTQGGNNQLNTITFDSAVLNPILQINSLGRGGNWGSTYFQNWTFTDSFTILSSLFHATGETGGSGYRMTELAGNVLHGEEGHGSIQFAGSFTSISWTSDIAEDAAFFSVGYDNDIVPVPEPATLALLALGLVGVGARKRKIH